MELLLEIVNKETERVIPNDEQDGFQEVLSLIEEMNIVGFEPFLDEDLNDDIGESFPGKYHILAILRDLFIEFKEQGDTRLIIERGSCGHQCDRTCPVFNLQGNSSGKNFAFGLDKMDDSVVNFHTCYGFVDKQKTPKIIDGDMMINSLRKASELKGEDTSRYNDGLKLILMSAVNMFHQ